MMKDGVIVVNTARGGVCQEDDVLDAVDSGKSERKANAATPKTR